MIPFVPGDPLPDFDWGPTLQSGPCWVIGNGPSLRSDDLTNIRETSWATNHIHLMYDRTSWRPDYWVATELMDNRIGAWHTRQSYECFLTANRADKIEKFRPALHRENVHYLPMCGHLWKRHDNPDRPTGLHLPEICLYGSSGSTAIQLAILYGHNPIFLLGFDARILPAAKDAPDPNHFSPVYGGTSEQEITPGLADRWTRTWHDAHRQVAEAARELGVRIINCSRYTSLDCYETGEFEDHA